jgi:thioredoxin 1
MLTPTIDAISEEYNDRSTIVKVNVDEAPAIATKYGIRSIPSLLFFNKGKVIEQKVGAVSKEELTSVLDKLIEG